MSQLRRPLSTRSTCSAKFSDAASAVTPDWTREKVLSFWDPGRKLLRSIRRYGAARARGGPIAAVLRRYWALEHLFWSTVTQSEIHLNCTVGGGLLITHPTGIIIHPKSTIGPNCLIFHQVTLAGEVTVGGHVDIGAGAKLIGPITIGDHVRIGANAVVTRDIPGFTDAYGVPARIYPRADDPPPSQSEDRPPASR